MKASGHPCVHSIQEADVYISVRVYWEGEGWRYNLSTNVSHPMKNVCTTKQACYLCGLDVQLGSVWFAVNEFTYTVYIPHYVNWVKFSRSVTW